MFGLNLLGGPYAGLVKLAGVGLLLLLISGYMFSVGRDSRYAKATEFYEPQLIAYRVAEEQLRQKVEDAKAVGAKDRAEAESKFADMKKQYESKLSSMNNTLIALRSPKNVNHQQNEEWLDTRIPDDILGIVQ